MVSGYLTSTSLSESTLYVKKLDFDLVIVYLYVDDLLVIGGNEAWIIVLKHNMMKMFEMTELGEISYFLGMEIKQAQNEIFVCQRKYLKEILKRFGMRSAKV